MGFICALSLFGCPVLAFADAMIRSVNFAGGEKDTDLRFRQAAPCARAGPSLGTTFLVGALMNYPDTVSVNN